MINEKIKSKISITKNKNFQRLDKFDRDHNINPSDWFYTIKANDNKSEEV